VQSLLLDVFLLCEAEKLSSTKIIEYI